MNQTQNFIKTATFLTRTKKNTPLQYPHMQTKKELRERELIHIYSIVKGKQERARERERPLGSAANTWRNNEHNCWDEIGHVSLPLKLIFPPYKILSGFLANSLLLKY